jgi:hypothetical protein
VETLLAIEALGSAERWFFLSNTPLSLARLTGPPLAKHMGPG